MQIRVFNSLFSYPWHSISVHPLVTVTIAFMFGIGWHLIDRFFVLLIGAIVVSSMFFLKQRQLLFLHGTFVLLGAVRYQWCIADKHLLDAHFDQKNISVIGYIKDIEYSDHKNYSMIVTVALQEINDQPINKSFFSNHSIKLFTSRSPDIRPADLVTIRTGKIKKPQGPYALYAWRDGIIGTAFIKKNSITVVNRPLVSISRALIEKRNALLDALRKKMSPLAFSFFSSLFLGNKLYYESELTRIKEQFKLWGLSHYLARSGLHLVLFIMIWELLLKFIPIPWFFKHGIILFFVFIYLLLSWMSVSFLRAFLTFILYKLYAVLLLPINGLYLLAVVTFLVLMHNPLHLFFLDFQLSFGLTFALIWFNAVTFARRQTV